MGDAVVTFSLKYQARVLAALPCDTINSKWFVGTTALREENEVRLMQYDVDNEQLVCKRHFAHAPELWDIAPCPTRDDLFVSVWAKAGSSSATLWRAPPAVPATSSPSPSRPSPAAGPANGAERGEALEAVAELPGHSNAMRCALWGAQLPETVVTVEEGHLRKWALAEGGVEPVSSCPAGEMISLWSGALHPRNPQLLCTAGSNDVQTWDLRSLARPMGEIKMAHKMPVRCISFAPHADTRVLTAGDDCKLRVWDLRSPGAPLMELGGHRHWVWRAAYNPVYDALIASASSDCCVNLYYTPNLAATAAARTSVAAPTGAEGGASTAAAAAAPAAGAAAAGGGGGGGAVMAAGQKPPARSGDLDGKVVCWDGAEDSVYGMCWSAADPWLLAALSADGRVAVHRVPKNIKYKILI